MSYAPPTEAVIVGPVDEETAAAVRQPSPREADSYEPAPLVE
jgi:hypothetical protein